MTSQGTTQRRLRYPGSPPFEDDPIDRALFFGRDADADAIIHSILGHDLVVLYAKSGIGKTSLLRAGVMDELRRRGLWPLVVRLNLDRDPIELVRGALLEQRDDDTEVLFDHPDATDLRQLMTGLEIWRGDELRVPVLIFDQFEEVFTIWSPERRERFVHEFATIARSRPVSAGGADVAGAAPLPRLKFVISIREDFLGELETFSTSIPRILATRYRLEPLTIEQAKQAIEQPAASTDASLGSPPFSYRSDAIDAILGHLGATTAGATTIEAFQLQILCRHIEDQVLPRASAGPDGPIITADDLTGSDTPEHILIQFYVRSVEPLDRSERRRVQDLCETGLISPTGRRLSLEREQIQNDHGVDGDRLDELVAQRLLRRDTRAGGEYYELAHDSLLQPLIAHREERIGTRRRRLLAAGGLLLAVAMVVVAFVVGRQLVRDDAAPPGPDDDGVRRLETGVALTDALEPFDADSFDWVTDEVGVATLSVSSDTGPTPNIRLFTTDADVASQVSTDIADPGTSLEFDVVNDGPSSTGYSVVVDVEPFEALDAGSVVSRSTAGERADHLGIATATDEALTFSMRGLDGVTGSVELLGAATAAWPLTADADSLVTIIPDRAGTAVLRVDTTGAGSSSDYEVELTRSPATAVPDAGGVFSDELAGGEIDVFEVPAGSGDAITVTVTPDEGLDPIIELVGPDGTLRSTIDARGRGASETGTLLLRDPGSHLLRIRGATVSGDATVGAYEVDLRPRPIEPLALDQQSAVERDASIDDVGDVNAYSFEGAVGDAINLSVRPDDDFNGTIEVIGPAGDRVTEVDAGGDAATESTTAVLTDAGTHTILVRGFDGSTGAYTITAERLEVTELSVGDELSGRIDGDAPVAVHRFEGDADDVVRLTLDPADDFNGLLDIIDERGDVIGRASSGGVGDDETVSITLPTDGTYHALISGFLGSTGDYRVRLGRTEPDSIVDGQTISGSIDETGQVELYQFVAPAGDAVTIRLTPTPELDGIIEVLGTSSEQIALVDEFSVGTPEATTIIVPRGGIHTVIVRGFGRSTGGYELEYALAEIADIEAGVTTSGELDGPVDVDLYRFEGAVGDRVQIAIAALDPELAVIAELLLPQPAENPIVQGDPGGRPLLTRTLPADDVYVITVTAVGSATGAYDLTLTVE